MRTEAARTLLAIDREAGVERLLATVDGPTAGEEVLEAAAQVVAADPERAAGPVRGLAVSSAESALESGRLADSIGPNGNVGWPSSATR